MRNAPRKNVGLLYLLVVRSSREGGGSNDPQGRTGSFWVWWRWREDDASEYKLVPHDLPYEIAHLDGGEVARE